MRKKYMNTMINECSVWRVVYAAVCMYVRMYDMIYMYVCMYVCMYVSGHTYSSVYVYMVWMVWYGMVCIIPEVFYGRDGGI